MTLTTSVPIVTDSNHWSWRPARELVPFDEIYGTFSTNRRPIFVNRRLVTHIAEWREWRSEGDGPRHTRISFGSADTEVNVVDPIEVVAAALETGRVP